MREKLVAVVAFAVLFAFPGFARNAAHGYAPAVITDRSLVLRSRREP
jgi:hypothetical protein